MNDDGHSWSLPAKKAQAILENVPRRGLSIAKVGKRSRAVLGANRDAQKEQQTKGAR